MKKSSISYLKNHLSASLKNVVAGESVLITDRNRAVAMLSPLPESSSDLRLESLVAEGLVSAAKKPLDLKAFSDLPKARCERALSSAILEDREDR